MTDLRKLFITFEAEIRSFGFDGYKELNRADFGDEYVCEMLHTRTNRRLTLVCCPRYSFIKIIRDGKLSKQIEI